MALAAGYARFSSEMQNELSLEAQFAKIQESARKNGDQLIAEYQDKAETGKTPDRNEFMKMFDAIKEEKLKVSRIYVFKFSRFMRNDDESMLFKMILKGMGVEVVSVSEPLPADSYMSRSMEKFIALVDGMQSDVIGLHVMAGMERLATLGYWTGGPPPYGYSLKTIPNKEGHKANGEIVERATLELDAKEAALVKRIFDLASSTAWGGHRIYKKLCEENGSQVLGRFGKPLGGRGVNNILRKPIYKGLFIYNSHGIRLVYNENNNNGKRMRKQRYPKTQDKWVTKQNEEWRIVSDEIWEKAQQNRLAHDRKDFGHGPKRASYLLTGMFKCDVCNGSVAGHWQHSKNSSYYYYRCRNAMAGGTTCCNKAKPHGKELEEGLINTIERNFPADQLLENLASKIAELVRRQDESKVDKISLERQLGEVSDQIRRLTELALNLPDTTEIAERLGSKEKERQLIKIKLAAYGKPLELDGVRLREEIQKRIGKTRDLLKTEGDLANMRMRLKQWITEVRLKADGTIWVKWNRAGVLEQIQLESNVMAGIENEAIPVLDTWYQLQV